MHGNECEGSSDDLLHPVIAGNPVVAFQRLIAITQKGRMPRMVLRRLVDRLLDEVKHCSLSRREHDTLAELLQQSGLKDHGSLVQRLPTPIEVIQTDHVGVADCLFVSTDTEPWFGCVHSLVVTIVPDDKGIIEIKLPKGNSISRLQGQVMSPSEELEPWLAAMIAAVESVGGWINAVSVKQGFTPTTPLSHHSFSVQLKSLRVPDVEVTGMSVGMALAMAIVSRLFNKPVPADWVFTGCLDIAGTFDRVIGLEQKLAAAELKMKRKVFIPKENMTDVTLNSADRLVPCQSIGDLIDHFIGQPDIETVRNMFIHPETITPYLDRDALGDNVVLVSWVGNRDPFGATYPSESSPYMSAKMDGPILAAWRWLRPTRMLLLPNAETRKNAERVKNLIDRLAPVGHGDVLIESIESDDPTDYDALAAAVTSILRRRDIAAAIEHARVFFSLSSGTAQMHTIAAVLLRQPGAFLNARAIQVRDPNRLKPGKERVSIVTSSFLGLE